LAPRRADIVDEGTGAKGGGIRAQPLLYAIDDLGCRGLTGAQSRCAQAVPAEVALPAHSAPLGLTFGDQFNAPQPYKDSIYIAYHGSWNRSVKTGYKVVRVPFVNGQAGQPEDFAWGWLPGSTDNPGQVWGRPVGVTVAQDGSLLVSEDGGNTIWRVSYGR